MFTMFDFLILNHQIPQHQKFEHRKFCLCKCRPGVHVCAYAPIYLLECLTKYKNFENFLLSHKADRLHLKLYGCYYYQKLKTYKCRCTVRVRTSCISLISSTLFLLRKKSFVLSWCCCFYCCCCAAFLCVVAAADVVLSECLLMIQL